VKTADMFAAMNTPDAANDNKTRGLCPGDSGGRSVARLPIALGRHR
jgi:hypothetical protein